MYINVDGLEIMVRLRRDDLMQEAADEANRRQRLGYSLTQRALIHIGGLFVTIGMAIEKLGVGRDLVHLTTTASRSGSF
jgi:hypothetical protein